MRQPNTRTLWIGEEMEGRESEEGRPLVILHDGDNQQQEYINEGKGVRTGCITQHTLRSGHNNITMKVEENELKAFIQVTNDECE